MTPAPGRIKLVSVFTVGILPNPAESVNRRGRVDCKMARVNASSGSVYLFKGRILAFIG